MLFLEFKNLLELMLINIFYLGVVGYRRLAAFTVGKCCASLDPPSMEEDN